MEYEQTAARKTATCADCNKKIMKNEIIATCKSASNSAIHKKSPTRKKVQHENITIQTV